MKKAVTNDHTLSDVQKRQIRRDKKQMNGCQGPWQGEMGASLWNDENVLELDSGDCSTPCECSKKHCIVDFKIDSVANFMLYVFHCKKKKNGRKQSLLGADLCLGTLTLRAYSHFVPWVPQPPTLTLALVSTASSMEERILHLLCRFCAHHRPGESFLGPSSSQADMNIKTFSKKEEEIGN